MLCLHSIQRGYACCFHMQSSTDGLYSQWKKGAAPEDSSDSRWSETMEVSPSVSPLPVDRARCDTAPSADASVVCLFLRWEALIRETVLFSF